VNERVSLALVLHNHQPVGNFGWVIAEAYERSYEPLLAALERHPRIRLGLHYTGPLLDWITAERPSFLERLAALVAANRVEILGGGYYEPVLASLPERDRLVQLRTMADVVERIGGRRPTGAWLAERVWEPDLPVSLVDAGYTWTVLDDAHFRAAAIDETRLWGSYTTDDQGRLLTVFGSDKGLRYRIPFGDVAETIAYLRERAAGGRHVLAMMGDDGEKFGMWPDTYAHCWGTDGRSGWIDRFFDAIVDSGTWLDTITPSEWTAHERPLGRVYLPTASYAEMGEWALPADEGLAFEAALHAAEKAERPEARWLRGGFWRNFQVKYREVNDLHKQMLRVSNKVEALAAGPGREAALAELLQGQSNDCYWHGIFGGIYIGHMRLATYEHLIAAEDIADAAARAAGLTVDGIATLDADLDGIDELVFTSPGQVVVVDPAEGGGIGSWDIRAVRHALAAVMRRRPEAYHRKLVDQEARQREAATGASHGPEGDRPEGDRLYGQATASASIHDVVRSREPGLAARLYYDGYERRGGLVHLLAPGTSAESFATAAAAELSDAHAGSYDVVEVGDATIVLLRDVIVEAPGSATSAAADATTGDPGPAIVRIEKRLTFAGGRRDPGLDMVVTATHRSGPEVIADLAIEWPTMLLGGGGNPVAYYLVEGQRTAHDGYGTRPNAGRVRHGNDYIGLAIDTSFDPPATVWWSPIETISNSEAGFERVYQGSALVGVWPLRLRAGEALAVSIRHRIGTDRDRGSEVPENPSARGLRTTG
jgi:alpha-amylase